MQVILKSDSVEYHNASSCTAIEYPSNEKDINIAGIIINGRYPETGLAYNKVCKLMAYVVKGSGKLVVESLEVVLNIGDVVTINPMEKYYWEGSMELIMPSVPAWTPDQYIHEE
ncbi:MAG: cupin domain-containing protein [bacterium]